MASLSNFVMTAVYHTDGLVDLDDLNHGAGQSRLAAALSDYHIAFPVLPLLVNLLSTDLRLTMGCLNTVQSISLLAIVGRQ
jgi:hypothetical protein